jgi:peptide/nickel transport system substrate-binding protein
MSPTYLARPVRTLACGVALALTVTACTGAPDRGAQESSVLTVATTANITTWDPIQSFSTEVFYLANIYEPLLWVNPEDEAERFRPALAKSWEASDDKLTWTFRLRDDVVFHDGEALTAEAVKLSIEAARERGGASFIWAPIDEITTPDDLTVEFALEWAAPLDLIASSMYGAWIVSPAALEEAESDPEYFETPVAAGTGPYQLREYTAGQQVVLDRFDDYWAGWDSHVHYDQVIAQITPESVVQQQLLEGGQVDLATSLPLENVGQLGAADAFTVTECSTFMNYLGFFNTTREPLDDPQVRRALSLAIPYEEIIAVGAEGFGSQARGPVPHGVFPYSDAVPQYQQDLDEAERLLDEAGLGDGFSLELTHAAENQAQQRFAPLIKDAFARIGVDVEINPILFNQQWERAKADPEDAQDIFLLLYWPTYSDAGSDNLWSLFRSSEEPFFNLSYWDDATYDGLIDEATTLTATEPAAAERLFGDAMTRLVEESPGFFLYDVTAPVVTPSGVNGLRCQPDYAFNLFFYELSPEA